MENRDTEGVNKFGGLNNLNSMDSSPLHERTDSEDYTSLDEDKGIKSTANTLDFRFRFRVWRAQADPETLLIVHQVRCRAIPEV
jgi:hypothetical protein